MSKKYNVGVRYDMLISWLIKNHDEVFNEWIDYADTVEELK